MDKDLKRIMELTTQALDITKRRAKQEIARLRKKGLNKKQVAEVSKKVASEALREGKRLKNVYQRELSSAMKRIEKLAKIESEVLSRRIKEIKKR
ncbi:hypothetical protein HY638_00840 [Candidatus Woesearchaeota archaeon]|nr:hypothetical protein [Candidatus Woesearchaeota archaeon]